MLTKNMVTSVRLQAFADCSAAVNNAYDGRRTMGVAIVGQRVWRPPNNENFDKIKTP